MTVKELKKALNKFPDNMLIINQASKTGFENILIPEKVIIKYEPENIAEYGGEYQLADKNDKESFEAVAIFRDDMRD
jgi:hypothetical protein